jgi:Rad3-related DNA helicase
MRKLSGPTTPHVEPAEVSDPPVELNLFPAQPAAARNPALSPSGQKSLAARNGEIGISTSPDFPEALTELLEAALAEAETWLAQNKPAEFREDLLALYFRLYSFRCTTELYDERYVTIIADASSVKVRLFCLDPSFLLRQALARGTAAIFFSATLRPSVCRRLCQACPDSPW